MSTARADSLDAYLREIGTIGVLDDADELAIARRARAGDDDAMQELVERNLRFVVAVAKRFRNRGLSLEDLIGEGNLGLIAAARRFDPDRGVRFISYAGWWVRQAITHAIVRQANQVRLPVVRVTALVRMARAATALRGELGRDATTAELAGRMGIAEHTIRAMQASKRLEVSIDAPAAGPAHHSVGDELAVDDGADAADVATRAILSGTVNHALAELAPREALVLRLYFGLEGEREHTLDEIGDRLGVTRERVRQVRERALSRLRRCRRASALANLF